MQSSLIRKLPICKTWKKISIISKSVRRYEHSANELNKSVIEQHEYLTYEIVPRLKLIESNDPILPGDDEGVISPHNRNRPIFQNIRILLISE